MTGPFEHAARTVPHRVRRFAWVGALVTTAVFAACGADDEGAAPEEIDQLSATTVQAGVAPWGVDVDGDTVWVSDTAAATLIAVDPTGEIRNEVPSGATDPRDTGLDVAGGRIWVANLGGTVGVVEVATGEVVGRVEVGPGEPSAVVVSGGAAWVAVHGEGGGLIRIDEASLRVTQRIELPESAFAVAVDDGVVWVAGLDRRVFAVDVISGEVTAEVDVGAAPRGIVVAAGAVWVTVRDDRAVVRLDPVTGEVVARIAVDGRPWPITGDDEAVWIALLEGGVLRIDPARNRVTGEAPTPPDQRGLAVGNGSVWATSQSGSLSRTTTDRRRSG